MGNDKKASESLGQLKGAPTTEPSSESEPKSSPNTEPTIPDEIEDTVLNIACLFLGFSQDNYWRQAVKEQHPGLVSIALELINTSIQKAKVEATEQTEREVFEEEQKYGKHVIPFDWKKLDDVYIWFEAFHHGIKWRGIPGYVYKKPDGTFTAPFRGELIDVIWDCKNEYRELAQTNPSKEKEVD